MTRTFFTALLLFTVALFSHANASSNSNGVINQPERVIPYAKQVEQELAKRGARVAIVARVGQAPEDLPSGIEYTHVAFWVYSEMTLPSGETINGYAVHNLYQLANDASESELVTDFPVEFFGDVYELRAGIIIPEPAVQQRLIEFIGSQNYKGLHVPNYSLIANPHQRKFQNCTNFVLNSLVGAVYQTGKKPYRHLLRTTKGWCKRCGTTFRQHLHQSGRNQRPRRRHQNLHVWVTRKVHDQIRFNPIYFRN
jgi:hypothetical protein